ncbi:MAG: nucleoside permease [Proteobacteria bacterium]|nr:nucleoside permease [Pseudomonadota bacterium]
MKVRLSLMMFLEFFIWGGWFVTMGSYLGTTLSASGSQIGLAYATQSWGAIIAPFIFGLIADRYFNAERVLAVTHLVGGLLLLAVARSANFSAFYPLLLVYMVLYMPTLALVNAVAFRQLRDPSREFSTIRVWGTVGWIVAGLCISFVFGWDSSASISQGALRNTFVMCGIASLLLGVYSLTLPKTPPVSGPNPQLRDILGLEALRLLANRNFLIFFVSSILICIPLAFYYQNANLFLTELHVPNATGKQTLGQMSEVLFMLLIPVFLNRFGMKTTLLVGMLAWAVRYLLFAFGNAGDLVSLLLIGIALHGVCYDFFFVSGQIYIDSKAGPQIKSAAQGLITLATYGAGMLIGFWAAGKITDAYLAAGGGHDWQAIWQFPAAFAAAVFVLFALAFRNENVRYEKS